MVPFDDQSPFVTSGMRIGTPAMTTRGMKEDDMRKITDMIDTVLKNKDSESKILEVKQEVNRWSNHFPLYQ
jgi:glycine hydroxymethyltransferase